MITIKIWCEGPSDRPIVKKLLEDIGEQQLAETLDYVGGWGNVVKEDTPQRWLDGCREAIMILDGDNGRHLRKTGLPLTEDAKQLQRKFADLPISLHILERYGIENYLPQTALEKILKCDLTAYFPLPHDKPLKNHLPIQVPYSKTYNDQIAEYLTIADVAGTDLERILQQAKQQAQTLRES